MSNPFAAMLFKTLWHLVKVTHRLLDCSEIFFRMYRISVLSIIKAGAPTIKFIQVFDVGVAVNVLLSV